MVHNILSANPFDWGWYGGVLYSLHPFSTNHKLRFSLKNSGALSDTRVFGMPFLENMTLRICFIIELFLSGMQITLGQPEKESTSINKSPPPVMYSWSICTWLYGSTCLGYGCKVVCVKFLNSLHFLHLFIYSLTSHEYPGHPTSNFILFCVATTPQYIYHHVHFLSPIFFVFLGELSDPHCKSLHVLSLTYVLFLCRISPPWSNFPICFFLFSMYPT